MSLRFTKSVLAYFLLIIFLFFGISDAQANNLASNWGSKDSDPTKVLDNVKDDSVQNTAIDKVSNKSTTDKKIKGTLDWLRENISPYMQWAVFIGLSVAVILIVYNGLLLVGGALSESVAGKVKTRMMYLSLGVVVVTGFYFIVKVVMSLVGNIV